MPAVLRQQPSFNPAKFGNPQSNWLRNFFTE